MAASFSYQSLPVQWEPRGLVQYFNTPIDCEYCLEKLKGGEGIVLQICGHIFCRSCLETCVRHSKAHQVKCPKSHLDGPDKCSGFLLKHEMRAVASEEALRAHDEKALQEAINLGHLENVYHCATRGCTGSCDLNTKEGRIFVCPICERMNCVKCQAIHDEISCEEYLNILKDGTKSDMDFLDSSSAVQKTLNSGFDQLKEYVKTYVNVQDPQNRISHDGVSLIMTTIMDHDYGTIIPSTKIFDCPICLEKVETGFGVIIRDCLHTFCRNCLSQAVVHSDDPELKCPFIEVSYNCNSTLSQREVKALVSDEVYDSYLARSIKRAEILTKNSFHCLTPDCEGWCEIEEGLPGMRAPMFICPRCSNQNCINCKVIHQNLSCEDYQERLRDEANRKVQKQNEQLGLEAVEASISKREFMRCPACNAVCQKISGCAHVSCLLCKHKFNWTGI